MRLQVIYKDPKALKPRADNPKVHSKKQIGQLKKSIQIFGFVRPILIDDEDGIVAGHGATQAALELGMADIPTVCVAHLSPAEIRAYVIADNKLAENSGWDRSLLALQLKELEVSLDFEVTDLGFETAEVDLLISDLDQSTDAADIIPEIATDAPTVTQLGDIWRIGDHFLMCGDSTNSEAYRQLLVKKQAQAVFTDPPFNVKIQGHVSGIGKQKHREFAMASGEMSKTEFIRFLSSVVSNLKAFSVDGSLHYLCMDWRHMSELLEAGSAYTEFKNLCVWAKTNAGMGSLYRSQHELVFVYKNGTSAHINNIELGRFGRNRSNLWTYAGVNTFSRDRDAELSMHPTVKPVALVGDIILDSTKRDGIVLDAFAGSGTTLIAAEKTGRRGYGIELDPIYCDTIIRRFEQVYNIQAVHVETEKNFSEVSNLRKHEVDHVQQQ